MHNVKGIGKDFVRERREGLTSVWLVTTVLLHATVGELSFAGCYSKWCVVIDLIRRFEVVGKAVGIVLRQQAFRAAICQILFCRKKNASGAKKRVFARRNYFHGSQEHQAQEIKIYNKQRAYRLSFKWKLSITRYNIAVTPLFCYL